MKDLIIGCCTNYDWDKIKFWVNSINKSGFEGDKVMVAFNISYDTVNKLTQAGFQVLLPGQKDEEHSRFNYQSNLPVHVERFIHIFNYLNDKEYRYVITTDVKDVVFQNNPSHFLEENLDKTSKQFIFASESMLYKDEPWGRENLTQCYGQGIYEDFKNNTIFNVGVLAGRGDSMRDLAAMIFAMSLNRPIAIVDQSTFNFMISQEPYLSTSLYLRSEDAWACQLGTTADPNKLQQFKPFILEPLPRLINGKITTSTGVPFTILHQYDRVPAWKEIIEVQYAD